MIGTTSSGAEIIDVLWWSTETTVGLVVIRLPAVNKYKAYIGATKFPGIGMSEAADATWTAEHGTRVHNTAAVELLMPRFAGVDWYEG